MRMSLLIPAGTFKPGLRIMSSESLSVLFSVSHKPWQLWAPEFEVF